MSERHTVIPPSVVAVFGISGVGKSTLIRSAISSCGVDADHVQASALLESTLPTSPSREELRKSSGKRILKNQNALANAFQAYLRNCRASVIVFDGHSVIDNGDELVEVPVETIRALRPDQLIFVADKAENILARRDADKSRIRPSGDTQRARETQDQATKVCQLYSQSLSTPLEIIQPTDQEVLVAKIRQAAAQRN